MDEIQKVLQELGMSDSEILVYLTLLKHGRATATAITGQVNLPRSTVKYTLDQLVKKDIIQSVLQGITVVYSIDSPSRLLYKLEQEKEEIEEKTFRLHQVLGKMKSLINPYAVLPKVVFYEGIDGLRSIYDSVLQNISTGEKILSFVKVLTPDAQFRRGTDIATDFIQKRVQQGISIRIIADNSNDSKTYFAKENSHKLQDVRFIKKKSFEFDGGEMLICGKTLYFISVENGRYYGISLTSNNLSEMQKTLFESIWDQAEK